MIKLRIGISEGIGGHYALLYDNEGPIQTGLSYYKTKEEAKLEAIYWNIADGIALDDSFNDKEKESTIKGKT